MSTFVHTLNKKGQVDKAVVKDVVFIYPVYGNKYDPIFDQKDWPKAKQFIFEQSVQILVDEDTADQIQEVFPKASIKKFLGKDKFLSEFPFEDTSNIPDMKKYFVVKFAQKITDSKGKFKDVDMLPKVKVVDREAQKLKEITFSKLVANGSKGVLVINPYYNKTYGQFGYFGQMLVTDLIEFKSKGQDLSDVLGNEFDGLVDEADESMPDKIVKKTDTEESNDFEDETEEFDEAPFDADDFE